MSNDWEQLIEKSFESSQNKTLNLLMETVREVMDEMGDSDILLEQEGGRFSISIPIPKLVPTEAWGDPSSQSRKDIERIFASVTREPDIGARIKHINSFLIPSEAVKKAPGGRINAVLNMMQIVEALQACLNDYNESSAGFVFEGFMAALTGGKQIAGRIGGTLPIEDFVAFSESGGRQVPTSLKLLSPKTPIHGSFTNLIDYLFIRGGSGEPEIKYLVAYKDKEGDAVTKMSIFDFTITRGNVIEMLLGSGKNNAALLGKMAQPLKQHIDDWQDSAAWRLRMAEILTETPGYTRGRGMFDSNLDAEGNFFDEGEEAPKLGASGFANIQKKEEILKFRDMTRLAGAEHQREDGPTFEEWIDSFDKQVFVNLGYTGLDSKTRKTVRNNEKKVRDDFRPYFEQGFRQAEATISEALFGTYHRIEKELLAESKGGTEAGSQWGLSSTNIIKMDQLLGTVTHGTLDLSQKNISEVAKIYIDKIGEDIMVLLESTKNFSENIGKYFSTPDRSEAMQANRDAISQGGQIISKLAADPAGSKQD
jgi:hypothetical protein